MLAAAFLGLLAVHTAYSLVTNWRYAGVALPRTPRRLHLILQAPLLWIAVYVAIVAGTFSRDLFSPWYIGLGLVAGHLIFGFSLLATHQSVSDAWTHFFDFGSVWNFTVNSPIVLTRFLGVAVAEELIWRVATQAMMVRILTGFTTAPVAAVGGILITAVAFVLVHKHFFENTWYVSVEFCVFAVLLGVLYYWTQSYILVVVIHAMRDIEIAYLEYLIKLDELGDEEAAAKFIEQSYMAVRPEGT